MPNENLLTKKNTVFNSAIKRAKVYHAIKHEIHKIEETKVGKAASKISNAPKVIKNNIVETAKIYTGWDYLEDIEVPWYRKVVPTFGALLGCITVVPAMIAMACPISQFLPPVMCVASFAKMVHDTTFLSQEYVERNLLREDLINKKSLQKQINKSSHYKKLQPVDKDLVQLYAFGKRDIYAKLYELRENIISDTTLSRTKKDDMIKLINNLIEEFSQDKVIAFNTRQIDNEIKENFALQILPLINNIKNYNKANNAINHKDKDARIDITSKLRHRINKYRITQDRIHAQDLPQNVKDNIEILIQCEGKDLEKVNIQSLYAKIGNHFINITAKEQIAAQDQSHENDILKYFHQDKDRAALTDYYQLPRKVFDILRQMRLNIENHLFDNQNEKARYLECIQRIIKTTVDLGTIQENDIQMLLEIENQLKDIAHFSLEDFQRFNQQLNQSPIDFEAIFTKRLQNEKSKHKIAGINSLKNSLTAHRLSSTLQYSMGIEAQYDSPHIAFSDDKNNLILQAENLVKNTYVAKKVTRVAKKLSHEYKKAKQQLGDKFTEVILGEDELNDKKAKRAAKIRKKEADKAIQDKFEQNNNSALRVLGKANKLATLEVTAPARWISLELSAAVFGLNVANTVVLAAAAAPGAQPVVIATTMMSSVSTALTVASIANDVRLSMIRYNNENKLNTVNDTLTKGFKPSTKSDREILTTKSSVPKKKKSKVSVSDKPVVEIVKSNEIPLLAKMQLEHIRKNLPIPVLVSASDPSKQLTYSYDSKKNTVSLKTMALASVVAKKWKTHAKLTEKNIIKTKAKA